MHHPTIAGISYPDSGFTVSRETTDQSKALIPRGEVPKIADKLALARKLQHPVSLWIARIHVSILISGQLGFIIQGLTIPANDIPAL